MSNLSPKASARSADRDATAVMVPPSAHCIASANPVAMVPGPITPQRIISRRLQSYPEGRLGRPDEAWIPSAPRRFLALITLSSAAAWDNASKPWRRTPAEPRQEDHDRALHPATGRPLHIRALDRGEPRPGSLRHRGPCAARSGRFGASA